MSRSGDVCVVTQSEQWYLLYGEPGWQAEAERCLAQMELFSPEARDQFKFALGWLREWACSREFGLGTRLPFDDKYLIESLSDSTIYMAYYTIVHKLHTDLDGQVMGPAGIRADQLTDAVRLYPISSIVLFANYLCARVGVGVHLYGRPVPRRLRHLAGDAG